MAEEKKKPGRPAGSKNKTSAAKKKTTRSSSAAKAKDNKNSTGVRVKDEIWAVIIIALGLFFAVAIQTKAAGEIGLIIKNFFLGFFGQVAIILPYYLILYGILLLMKKTTHANKRSAILLVVTFLMFSIIYSARFIEIENISFAYIDLQKWFANGVNATNGGVIGMLLALVVIVAIGVTGLYIFSSVVIIICLMMLVNTPMSQVVSDYKLKRQIKKQMNKEAAEKEEIVQAEKQKQLEIDVKKSYTPLVTQAKASEKKKNILGYMIDDKLFKNDKDSEEVKEKDAKIDVKSEPEIKISYGLEEIVPVPDGFGLEGDLGNIKAVNSNTVNLHDEEQSVTVMPSIISSAANVTAAGASTSISFAAEPEHKIAPSRENSFTSRQAIEDRNKSDVQERGQQMQMKLTKQEAANAQLNQNELNLSKSAEAMAKYEFPLIEFLNKNNTNKNDAALANNLKAKAAKLEKTLQDFKVDAKVVQVTQGPAVTRYEIHPNTGVKVSSIVRLADDIALNLEAKSIRIEAPIPGKAAVGIEVENEKINMVTLREIVDSKEFRDSKSKITFAVGKDIAGKAIVADLKSMPHMLIAGSTGSGKSVCINSIIISILYKAKPDEVKFVLIDPKVVELGNYNGIPHMLIPVVTEPSKAAAALNWAVAEMTDRYKKFAEEGVRDLAGFNDSVKQKGEPDRVMPQIVIIIDELADLMMAAPSQVEESICRLAQMARAAGMHLIVATQRPSVDIITGVIKANIPSRIAFAVSSQFDSRTILDMAGAEKLVGKGDMLFNPLGSGKPVRVQGNFISDSEVHNVIEHLKKQCTNAEYANDVIHTIEKANSTPEVADDGDELLPDAIETVVRAEQASVSMLQRRFRIGYNRAARIIDMMEARGIVGPADGSRPRQVLMTLDEFMGLHSEGSEALEDKSVPEEI
ncbi:MAG: DNA translocase FtsK [Aminipila sp.]